MDSVFSLINHWQNIHHFPLSKAYWIGKTNLSLHCYLLLQRNKKVYFTLSFDFLFLVSHSLVFLFQSCCGFVLYHFEEHVAMNVSSLLHSLKVACFWNMQYTVLGYYIWLHMRSLWLLDYWMLSIFCLKNKIVKVLFKDAMVNSIIPKTQSKQICACKFFFLYFVC